MSQLSLRSLGILITGMASLALNAATLAPKPLFRDPLYDGAADPVLIQEKSSRDWLMFYTLRRANDPSLAGVSWVHGTPIGIARSQDQGNTWKAEGLASIRLGEGPEQQTLWAPELIEANGVYHMFLTVVPGIFNDWKHPRHIVHLTSADLRNWTNPERLELGSERVIDACVAKMADGTWRLWYNNELDRKSIYWAESRDLTTWTLKGKAVGDQSGEGPKVFHWKNSWWMITDIWRGLAVYKSQDATQWTRQSLPILDKPGTGADDQVIGGHADIVVAGDRAFIFYFTHPGRRGADAKADGTEQRRSSIQVAELCLENGEIRCKRDEAVEVRLPR